ncbi:hypothetical protein DZ11F45_19980 [Escherichia coli]
MVISHKSAQNHTKSPHPAPHKACRFYQAALTPPRIDHYPTIALNIWLYISIPKTFFPEQDTGVLMGGIQADQSISFQAMRGKLQDFMKIIRDDPAVDNVTGFTGGSRVNSGMMFITLKPRDERSETAQQIIDRLRVKLAKEPGANLFLMAVQDIRVGGRQSNASYQYTLLSDDLAALRE